MKKLFFGLILLGSSIVTNAQIGDKIGDAMNKKDFAAAKIILDKYMANPKNAKDIEAFYYKGYIYNQMSKDEKLQPLCGGDCIMTAFEAFKEYNTKDKTKFLLIKENNVSFVDIYGSLFDIGGTKFTAKDFTGAFEGFSNAIKVQTYCQQNEITYNSFVFPKVDTSLVNNAALSAENAKMDDEAAKHYKMLVDAGIAGPNYLRSYYYLVDYYKKKGDKENFDKYIKIGEKEYPKDEYWFETKVSSIMEGAKGPEEEFTRYETILNEYPERKSTQYNYCAKMYNYLYTGGNTPTNYEGIKTKLIAEISKMNQKYPDYAEAYLLMAKLKYNESFDFGDQATKIKKPDPASVKQKKILNDKAKASMMEALNISEKTYNLFKVKPTPNKVDKLNTKSCAEMCMNIYSTIKNEAKTKEFKTIYESL